VKYDPNEHHRRSIRLKGWDYSQAGGYFITICTRDRACLFGNVRDGQMRMNDKGRIAHSEWFKTAELRSSVRLSDDEFVVMPNHIHGIIWIVDDVGATRRVAPIDMRANNPHSPQSGSIGAIIGQYKSAITKRINALRGTRGSSVWQDNYYEHIIRNEKSLNCIRQYILDNPSRWAFDSENPAATSPEADCLSPGCSWQL
jgi:putative transposase